MKEKGALIIDSRMRPLLGPAPRVDVDESKCTGQVGAWLRVELGLEGASSIGEGAMNGTVRETMGEAEKGITRRWSEAGRRFYRFSFFFPRFSEREARPSLSARRTNFVIIPTILSARRPSHRSRSTTRTMLPPRNQR